MQAIILTFVATNAEIFILIDTVSNHQWIQCKRHAYQKFGISEKNVVMTNTKMLLFFKIHMGKYKFGYIRV